MRRFALLISLWQLVLCYAGVGPRNAINARLAEGDLYVLCIGIDDYSHTSFKSTFSSCASDAKAVHDKVIENFESIVVNDGSEHGAKYTFLLQNEAANAYMIKEIFRRIAIQAKAEDHFILFYAGISWTYHQEEYIIPYYNCSNDSSLIESSPINLKQLASWMENIAAQNQLIISEAGNGENFAKQLISDLFENNAILASELQRNRMVLTTQGIGQEGRNICGTTFNGGYLASFVLNTANIFLAFDKPNKFEMELVKREMHCDKPISPDAIYTKFYQEEDFRWLLVDQQLKMNSRGPIVEDLEDDNTVTSYTAKKYALVISTNTYLNGAPSWSNLDNPKHDAEEVAKILQQRYGFEVTRIHDQVKDSITWALKHLKSLLNPQDKVLIFIAGHGYYDKSYNDGFLVFKDGLAVNSDMDDRDLESYLPMGKLNNMVNGMPSKNIFIILDVCFGAQFDVFAEDLKLTDYQKMINDEGLEGFYARKDSLSSRIFLASGKGEVPDHWSMNLSHSPFAGKLILALKEEERFLSPGKIYEYMEGNVTLPYLKQFGGMHDTRGDFIMPVIQH